MNGLRGRTRELALACACLLLLGLLLVRAHGFFTAGNFVDLFLANMPVLLVALGMLCVILAGEIDISVGSQFALCSVAAGVLARAGMPAVVWLPAACLLGAACGALNGALTGYLRLPSIVVTLATGVVLRDGLRWVTEGAWVGDLPANFPRFGLSGGAYTALVLAVCLLLTLAAALCLNFLRTGRAVFATGSNSAGATQLGIDTKRVVLSVFTLTGALTGLAASLNAVRFTRSPAMAALGWS